EREGISFNHPARFILVGTMNPEEGDLRPQLLDRFALSVDIHGLQNARERVEIMERRLAYEDDPEGFGKAWESQERDLTEQIKLGRELVNQVTYTTRNLVTIASLTSSLHVDGHRADLVILKAARAQAAFDGRTAINDLDIAMATELALPHRLKRGPFEQAGISMDELRERIDELQGQMQPDPDAKSQPQPGAQEDRESQKKK
ncbi:MAG: magnesium chelatase, partial [Anaerolineaceae bacterium]|nr:magnesium chelatase [Anaerolineaceae bacterium]